MEKSSGSINAEVYSRTASLFAMKRAALGPEAFESLAADIVRRLARGKALAGPSLETPFISPKSIAAFCDALILPEAEPSLRFITERRAEGVTRQEVYLGYITAAARHLGELWQEDQVSLLDVTIGTGHLYALMRALRREAHSQPAAYDARRFALFATVPGEDHGIGITVAADLFREAGWDIDLQTGTDHEALITHIEHSQPHIIGLSLSTEQRLAALARLVVAIRIILPRSIIGVAASHSVNAKRINSLVDIDLVFHDARSSFAELDRLVRLTQ